MQFAIQKPKVQYNPSCNPYLACAVVIASGLDGIRNKIMPPDSIAHNIYRSYSERRKVN
ncbi:MAG: hypothetical protein ACOX44_16475 [Limnochordia bacterium]